MEKNCIVVDLPRSFTSDLKKKHWHMHSHRRNKMIHHRAEQRFFLFRRNIFFFRKAFIRFQFDLIRLV